jgi:phosphoribosylamine--glycine ligase
MRILVIGAGAREHALAWALAREADTHVIAAPGNPGIASVAQLAPVAANDIDGLLERARRDADLTVVGPEAPLAAGLVDRFVAAGCPVLGPTRAAARLETSKAFAKKFMERHRVPTARHAVCRTPDEARAAAAAFGVPVVLKADGLAGGKGVTVAEDAATVAAAIDAAMVRRVFGDAGTCLVLEEYLRGQEASFFVLCDGRRSVFLGTAQDHKRAFDGDRGPNTGGMGAFAPSVLIDADAQRLIERLIVDPVLAGMAEENMPFVGILYVGLMMTAEGPRVIEFNVRFGDPEAQVLLPSFDEPLGPWLAQAAAGRLPAGKPVHAAGCLVGVVLASEGYPGRFETGRPITGLERVADLRDVVVFHGGTALREGKLVTDGGRVLTVVGRDADLASARHRAYEGVDRVHFDGCHFRRDIASKAIPLLTPPA